METIALPGTVTVRDPEPVVAYLASYRAWADQQEVPFDATVERARDILVDHIAREGAFHAVTGGGAGLPPVRRSTRKTTAPEYAYLGHLCRSALPWPIRGCP